MKPAVMVYVLLNLISCGGGGHAASTGFDAGTVDAGTVDAGTVDAASDAGSGPMDAGIPVDRCARVSCTTAPAATCDGSVQRTYDPVGTCSDGVCSYTSHDTPCAAGCANAACIDPCAGVTCTRPPEPSCDGDKLRTFADTGTCSNGTCIYASSESTCELGCRTSTCFNPDPRLEDPTRVSLPFECAGTPLTAAQIIEHVAQGNDTISLNIVDDTRDPHFTAFSAFQFRRTCQPLTGCSPWSGGRDNYSMRLWVTPAGDLQLIQDDVWFAGHSELEATIQSGDLQTVFGRASLGGLVRQYRVLITRDDRGLGCLSATSASQQDPPNSDGSFVESFWLGRRSFPAPVPRTTPAPFGTPLFQCTGTPASNAQIASFFPPGQTQLRFRGNNTSVITTQQCHPITGCSPWTSQFLLLPQLRGLKATATAFALWFDTVNVPVVDGQVNTTVNAAAYTGFVTTDGCVSYDRVNVVNTPPSAMITTTHTQEQNTMQ